jgi:hypothetical protein
MMKTTKLASKLRDKDFPLEWKGDDLPTEAQMVAAIGEHFEDEGPNDDGSDMKYWVDWNGGHRFYGPTKQYAMAKAWLTEYEH